MICQSIWAMHPCTAEIGENALEQVYLPELHFAITEIDHRAVVYGVKRPVRWHDVALTMVLVIDREIP